MSNDPLALGKRARKQLPKLIEAVRHDGALAQWHIAALPEGELAAYEMIDGWRASLQRAGFGDEFQLQPLASKPNRYWDPAVTRLWNHHAVISALYELVEFGIDARTLNDTDLQDFLHAAPWEAPLEVIADIGPRIASNMDSWFDEPT